MNALQSAKRWLGLHVARPKRAELLVGTVGERRGFTRVVHCRDRFINTLFLSPRQLQGAREGEEVELGWFDGEWMVVKVLGTHV